MNKVFGELTWEQEKAMLEILPCPFCGQQPFVNKWTETKSKRVVELRVFCSNDECKLSDRTYPLEWWNKRAGA